MNIYAKSGDKVYFVGCEDSSVKWGQSDDPRKKLEVGKVYTVDHTEVHSWHTKVSIQGVEGLFPSVAFDDLEAP